MQQLVGYMAEISSSLHRLVDAQQAKQSKVAAAIRATNDGADSDSDNSSDDSSSDSTPAPNQAAAGASRNQRAAKRGMSSLSLNPVDDNGEERKSYDVDDSDSQAPTQPLKKARTAAGVPADLAALVARKRKGKK